MFIVFRLTIILTLTLRIKNHSLFAKASYLCCLGHFLIKLYFKKQATYILYSVYCIRTYALTVLQAWTFLETLPLL